MKTLGLALVVLAIVVCAAKPLTSLIPQQGEVSVDWKAELEKARAGIAKNPNSAFWHNQAGIAYDALGDFAHAVSELKLASSLDPTNPIDDYALYALYKRKGSLVQQREALLSALNKDTENPVGRFEFGSVLEKEGHFANALKEYRTAKLLVSKAKDSRYVDPRGNFYDIGAVRREVDGSIDRVAKLNVSKQHEK